MEKKIILHLCADTGSDSKPYADSHEYEVILVGSKIGVENYYPPANVYGIFANPPCTEFSIARTGGKPRLGEEGLFLVKECLALKEAGFPQTNPVYITGRIPNEKFVSYPTLSELIEACGEEFKILTNIGTPTRKWVAWRTLFDLDKENKVISNGSGYDGSTPEEAVAKLYLALKNKE